MYYSIILQLFSIILDYSLPNGEKYVRSFYLR